MYASVWPSEIGSTAGAKPPARQRADGQVRLNAALFGAVNGVADQSESGSLRLRLPRSPGPQLEAVLINTGGGVAGGDRFSTDIRVAEKASLVVTTASAERIYRSDGSTAEIATALSVEAGGRLDWIPQETIVFDRARLRRRLDIKLAADARLTMFEALVFGRLARGERIEAGSIADRWRIRRNGRLVLADTLRLDGPIAALLGRPALAGGYGAMASLIHVAPDSEARLDDIRDALADIPAEWGASAWNGLLAIRFLAHDIETLRAAAIRAITALRGAPMPRVWLT